MVKASNLKKKRLYVLPMTKQTPYSTELNGLGCRHPLHGRLCVAGWTAANERSAQSQDKDERNRDRLIPQEKRVIALKIGKNPPSRRAPKIAAE